MILECALTPFIALRGILAAANAPIACRAASPSLRIASGNIHYVATLHETNGQPRSTRRSVVVLTLSKTVAKSHNAIFIGRQEALASQLEHSEAGLRRSGCASTRGNSGMALLQANASTSGNMLRPTGGPVFL
ncbi:hypothetical protein PG989_005638 [Apiospora arundinis]